MVRIREKLDFILMTLLLSGLLSTQTFAQETNCGDRIDDDGDGLVDCFDPDCGCYTCDNKQDNSWLFSGGSLDFNNLNANNSPQISQGSPFYAYEGSASVADPNGHFLFATNGQNIVGPLSTPTGTRLVNFSVNYNSITLKGGSSATHPAVALPNPNDQQEYYIFTTGDELNNQYGVNAVKLRFQNTGSAPNVDMEASISLPTNNSLLPAGQNTEKLAVARHSNCKDYWVVTHDFGATTSDGKNYISYLVNTNGINAGINSLQTVSHVTDAGRDNSMRGQLSFSEDYTTLVAAVMGEVGGALPDGTTTTNVSGFIEITNFDKATGNITPDKVLPMVGYNPYGVCLSPSKRYLYVSARDFGTSSATRDKLLYFDLQAGNIQAILNSQEEIPLPSSIKYLGQLKIGTNGKLYLAANQKGVLELEPEIPSAYVDLSLYVSLFPRTSTTFGLPQTIPDYCEPTVKAFANPEAACTGEQVSVWASPLNAASPVQYTWNTGQTTSSFLDNPQQTTTYSVSITDHYGCSATGQVEATVAQGARAIPDFHFQHSSGLIKSTFGDNEIVYLDAGNTVNATSYWLDLWEVTPTGVSYVAGGGWNSGPNIGILDVASFFNVTLQHSKTYQVKLAVQNLPCTPWAEMVLNFEIIATFTSDDSGRMNETRSLASGEASNTTGGKKLAVLDFNNTTNNFDFNLFPNPATDLINIATKASVESIQIIDTHGRMIKQLHGSERVISINDLPAGIYMVELRMTDAVAHKRFIKT